MGNETGNFIKNIRKYLKNKIINSTDGFNGHTKEVTELVNLIQRSVEKGSSNSVLIIGPRASGKTILIREILKKLEVLVDLEENAILIKLNGLIHTDDKLALTSCTLQMNLESATNGKIFGTFAENLTFLLDCLRSGDRTTSKCLIFILEELDLFCDHSNQTLLYNLFDMIHTSQTPICVIGISCRLDVVELFEKRVKSRFSHRQIYIFPNSNNNDSFKCYVERIKNLLSVTSERNFQEIGISSSEKNQWNQDIVDLVNLPKFNIVIQRLFDITLDERILKNILIMIISKLNNGNSSIRVEDFAEEIKQLERDDKALIIESLSVLELCLLIAISHHCEIYDSEPFNFEMVLTRYSKFANTNSLSHTIQRPVLLKAFEHLKSLELIQPIGSAVGYMQKEYQLYKLLVHKTQINEGVKQFSGVPTEVQQWAISNLI